MGCAHETVLSDQPSRANCATATQVAKLYPTDSCVWQCLRRCTTCSFTETYCDKCQHKTHERWHVRHCVIVICDFPAIRSHTTCVASSWNLSCYIRSGFGIIEDHEGRRAQEIVYEADSVLASKWVQSFHVPASSPEATFDLPALVLSLNTFKPPWAMINVLLDTSRCNNAETLGLGRWKKVGEEYSLNQGVYNKPTDDPLHSWRWLLSPICALWIHQPLRDD